MKNSQFVVLATVAVLSFAWKSRTSVDAFGIVRPPAAEIGARARSQSQSREFCFGTSRMASMTTSKSAAVTSKSTTRLFAALPEGYQEFGNSAIREAARQCGLALDGNDNDDDDSNDQNPIRLDIEWKAGSIIVTVHGDVSLAATGGSTDGEDEEDEEAGLLDIESDIDIDAEVEEQEEAETVVQEEFSLTLLARTINRILDDEGTGLAIAEVHSIEVTTPGVSDELVPGTPQFDAFKGFEVIVRQTDPKKNDKTKTIEGRLVERNDTFTVINMKGRMKKIRNDTVQSIRLPKAKREKGSR